MPQELLTRYLGPLLAGRRVECSRLIAEALASGASADQLIHEVLWPAMREVQRLQREDRVGQATENMACRINHLLAAQLRAHLPRVEPDGRRVLIVCVGDMHEELAAQMVSHLFEADGWETYFLGGGVPHDEILSLVGQLRPQVLVLFGTTPQAVPHIRRLVEIIREIGVCATMNIVVCGGVFERADGLWQEVGADGCASDPRELLRIARQLPPRAPDAPRPGGLVKRRRRRRRLPDSTAPHEPARSLAGAAGRLSLRHSPGGG